MSRELQVDERLIYRWLTDDRPVSERYSELIPRIAAGRQERRSARKRAQYIAMVESLTSSDARHLMLAILAEEVEIRVAAIARLANHREQRVPSDVRNQAQTLG